MIDIGLLTKRKVEGLHRNCLGRDTAVHRDVSNGTHIFQLLITGLNMVGIRNLQNKPERYDEVQAE